MSLPKLQKNIRPLGDRVVVVPMEQEQETASGIIIPDTAGKERPRQGTVIALGDGGIVNDKGVPSPDPHQFLKKGDQVLFGLYSGDDAKVKDTNGKEVTLRILSINTILGIVD